MASATTCSCNQLWWSAIGAQLREQDLECATRNPFYNYGLPKVGIPGPVDSPENVFLSVYLNVVSSWYNGVSLEKSVLQEVDKHLGRICLFLVKSNKKFGCRYICNLFSVHLRASTRLLNRPNILLNMHEHRSLFTYTFTDFFFQDHLNHLHIKFRCWKWWRITVVPRIERKNFSSRIIVLVASGGGCKMDFGWVLV